MVKVKRAQEARVNQFLFQIVQDNKIFKIKLGTIVELTLTTQKTNTYSLLDWLFRSVVPSFGKFGPKTQNCQFKLKFGT